MAVVVPIQTEFDASGVNAATSKFAKFSQTLSKSLQSAGADARKAFAQVEQGANESSTAAQRLAAAIGKTATKLDADLMASKAAADALGRALGPEFAAKVGQNGLNRLVTDLNRAGVSIKEITAEADVLAAAIKQVDDVNLKHVSAEADMLRGSMNGVAASADRSRGVFANFAGNAAQEIPGVANALGPLNVAIGQFAEYATEGGISLKNFVKALGPIAVISGGLLLVKGAMQATKEQAELAAARIETVRDAILSTSDAIQTLSNKNAEALQIKVFDPNAGVFGKTRDITKQVDELGLSQDKLNELLRGGKGAIEAWADTVEGSRKPLRRWALDRDEAESAALVYKYLNDNVKDLKGGTEEAARAQRVFGVGLSNTAQAAKDARDAVLTTGLEITGLGSAQEYAATTSATMNLAIDATTTATANASAAVVTFTDAIFANIDAEYQAADSAYRVKKAVEEYEAARKKAQSKPEDLKAQEEANRLQEAAARAAFDGAKNTYELAKAQSQQTTDAGKAAEAAAKVLGGYQDLADTLGPNDPLRANLREFIKELEAASREYVTRVRLDLPSGMIGGGTSNVGVGVGGAGMPGLTGGNTVGRGPVYNITVNGATNSQETANLVSTTIDRADQRQGRN